MDVENQSSNDSESPGNAAEMTEPDDAGLLGAPSGHGDPAETDESHGSASS